MLKISTWYKRGIVILCLLLFIVAAFFLYSIYQTNNNQKLKEINRYQIIPTINPTVIPTNIPTFIGNRNMTSEEYEDNQKRFVSSKLGISFYYIAYYPKEVENKVYLCYAEGCDYASDQSVEVFTKSRKESLKDAITRMFLLNKDPKQCEVKITNEPNLPSSYVTAEIGLPSNFDITNIDPDEFVAKTQACSKYATPTYISYFLEDQNHPDKFIYVKIGLEVLMGSETKTWQDTITFLD